LPEDRKPLRSTWSGRKACVRLRADDRSARNCGGYSPTRSAIIPLAPRQVTSAMDRRPGVSVTRSRRSGAAYLPP